MDYVITLYAAPVTGRASITVDVRDEIKSRSVVGDLFLMRVIVAFDRKTYVGLHNKCIYTLQELQNLNDAHPNTF